MSEFDILLETQEKLDGVDLENMNQDFTPPPEGEYICEITEVVGKEFHGANGSKPAASLKFTILEGDYAKKYFYDTIFLPVEGESEGSMKRRVAVAMKLGLIDPKSKDKSVKINWKEIQGMRVKVEGVHESYEKEVNGKQVTRTSLKPSYAGYERIANDLPDDLADI